MGALGQVTCTFTINSQPFTQSFVVCKHMERPIILLYFDSREQNLA